MSFKTGYTGDIDGTKAQYKVEVIINRNGQEEKLYNQTFTPEVSKANTEMTVVKASDGKNNPQNFSTPGTPVPTKEELEAKMANNKPNGTGGTFKSKEIDLPEGVTEYTVRISSADNQHLGMGYQSPYRHYALPVTGLDFNVDQDTGAIAKDLLSRIYDKLKATETADTDGKTNETKTAYLAELENIKTLVTSTDVKKTAEYKAALESILSKQLALRVDKTGLTDSKALLDGLVNEDPTPGKTQDTATAYNAAKQEAVKAIEAAKKVIDNESATVADVREALATVNAKKQTLETAKQALVEAATAEEKAKLKADADSLVKADTTDKTPNSIEAYNTKYDALKAQLDAAKAEAATVLAKENNASKAEAQAAQAKVDAAKAELSKAAELLVNKADKTELKKAKEALSTLVTEEDPTTGKTADSAKTYNDAKTAATEAIKAAETVINDENATQGQVTEALNKVNEKKSALEAAKQALVEAATAEEKAKLKENAALLKKADETGKTPDSIAAYERKYEELKTQLEAAKAEAEKVLEKGNNATKEEVKAAQAKVDAVKTELENAKKLLVEAATTEEKTKLKTDSEALKKADTTGKTADSIKAYEAEYEKLKAQLDEAKAAAAAVEAKGDNATKAEAQEAQAKVDAAKQALEKAAELLKDKEDKTELTKAKEALSTLVSEADPTAGKTADSAKSYNDAKTAAEEAIKAAETVINDENATHDQVTEALNKVNEKKATLEATKQALVEAATAEEKAKLKADADSLVKADTTGKTPNSIAAYNTKYEALKAQLEAAKTEAAKVLAKENNASKAEAQAAQAKVDAAKAELTKAAELLVNKADKTELTKAKEALNTLVTEADPTTGKTADSAKAYNDAKTAAIEAIKAAEMVINDENATQEQVTEALNKVNEKKAALEAAKQALVEAATVEEKAKLKADSALLMKADETGKTPDSIAAYEAEYEKLKVQLEEAKVEAEKVLAKENNATKEEVKAAQAKVDVVKKALEKAAELLKDLVDKTKLTTEATTDAEETKGSPTYYNADEAKKAAYDKALAEAKKVLENDKATQAEVNAALKALEEAKAALNGQATNKDALTKAATTDAEETKGSPAYYNADEAKKAAYDKALAEAKKVLENDKATQAEVNAALKALEEAKAALNGQSTNKDALSKAATTDAEETKGSPAYYNADEAKKAAYDKALAEAKKVLENDKATQAEVNAALKVLEEAKATLNGQATNKDALTKAATTDAEETKGSPTYYNADEAKKEAYDKALAEAKKVLENDKATQAEVNAALKALEEAKEGLNGYVSYKINPAISEVEEFDITKLIVKGIVEVEKGQTLNENDIISKLNLPDGIEIVEIEYPETNTLGRKVVRVVLRGNDGNLFTVEVPVEVVEGKGFNNISIGNDNSANNGSKDKIDSETNQKLLPNTGTTETNTGLAGLGLAVLGGLLAVARRRKEK